MATYNNIKKIKIGDNVFNLYDSGNSGGTITSVKTTAGAHTAVNVTSGAVSFNVPTKTSHLTNDSGFITTDTNTWRAIQVNGTQVLAGTTGTNALNLKAGTGISLTNSSGTITITNSSTNTDEKVKAVAATASTKYYLVMGGNGGTAETKVYDARLSYTNTTDYSALTIGDASHDGNIQLCDSTSGYKSVLGTAQLTEARTLSLPDKTGTIALVSDITAAISYPVTSVNNKTGAVSLSASDVGAMPTTTLLWTNSSPTSSFTAKTVSLDLSAYSAIEIEFKHASSSNSFLYQKFKIPSDDMSLFYMTGKGTYFELESRAVTVTTTGVTFADGRRAQATWTASSDNIRCVPTRIFGIK